MEHSDPAAPVVVITGAGGGLGAATVALYADRGWRVVAVDLTAPPGGTGISSLAADVTDSASLAAVETLSQWRMEMRELDRGVIVLNDSYNANPDSMRAALDALAAIGDAREVVTMHQVYRRGNLVWWGPGPYR